MKVVQKAMKKQFNKKRRNPQELKVGENMWLEVKNIHLNKPSKKLDQKRYKSFKISKDIGQEIFQLELPEGWMIHSMFNENLITQCKEAKFEGQCIEFVLLPTIINEKEEYKVEEVRKHRK